VPAALLRAKGRHECAKCREGFGTRDVFVVDPSRMGREARVEALADAEARMLGGGADAEE